MINKYGNDFKNNIFWNKEYPFIPEVTNDAGFTIHEGDIVDFIHPNYKRACAARVYKIYDKNHIWVRHTEIDHKIYNFVQPANFFIPHTSNAKPPKLEDYDNQGIHNPLQTFLSSVYADIYDEELSLENDWHFDPVKYEAKRLEEVAKLKGKY